MEATGRFAVQTTNAIVFRYDRCGISPFELLACSATVFVLIEVRVKQQIERSGSSTLGSYLQCLGLGKKSDNYPCLNEGHRPVLLPQQVSFEMPQRPMRYSRQETAASYTKKAPEVDSRSVYSYTGNDESSRSVYEPYNAHDYSHENYVKPSAYELSKYPHYPPTYSTDEPLHAADTTEPYKNRPPTDGSEERGIATSLRRSRWRKPWFCWLVSLVQVAVFLGQCGHAWKLTGSPIQTKPSFNPMIGPSVYNAINMGARYPLCMKYVSNVTDVVTGYPCANTTTTAQLTECTLAELCGNGAKNSTQPKQWWRFVVPIFLHAGVLHILFNLLVQLRLGAQVEMDIGAHIFVPIYFASGIGGFLFGGNFAGLGVSSMGASGAIFGIISLTLLEHLYHWNQIVKPGKGLTVLLVDMVISFVLGLLPGVDNFSHIGGFIVGLLLGIAFLRSPDTLDRRLTPYKKLNHTQTIQSSSALADGISDTKKVEDMTFLEGRKPAWWAFLVLRLVCLVLTIVSLALLIKVRHFSDPV